MMETVDAAAQEHRRLAALRALAVLDTRPEHYSPRQGRWLEIVAYRPAPGQFAVLLRASVRGCAACRPNLHDLQAAPSSR